jgi:hypothetical protein
MTAIRRLAAITELTRAQALVLSTDDRVRVPTTARMRVRRIDPATAPKATATVAAATEKNFTHPSLGSFFDRAGLSGLSRRAPPGTKGTPQGAARRTATRSSASVGRQTFQATARRGVLDRCGIG